MKFVISNVEWDIEDIMEEEGIEDYDEMVEQLDLPQDDFEIELDYELEDEDNPTADEMSEIDELLADAISDKYGYCINSFDWNN